MTVLPVYLEHAGEAFPAFVHGPGDGAAASGLGVVFCPPFGWEDMSSYRPRRTWAVRLAEDGHTALRLDLPGTGDSAGGPQDRGRVEAWTGAIGAAAAHLRAAHGCRRVVAIGIGLGGMLAVAAAERGAPIDDFVLWGTVARGKAVLRQMSLFARMEAEKRAAEGGGEEPGDDLEPGALAVGGYVLSAETAANLKDLDLREPALPPSPGRRALVLEQDGMRADAALVDGLGAAGVDVAVAAGLGFGKMMLEPQFSQAPEQTMTAVSRWLAERPAVDGAPGTVPAPAVADELLLDGGAIRERFVTLAHPHGDMIGVVSEPADVRVPARALLLGGTGHRIGPNRMWVEAARRWAARGVPCVRLDLTGVGDADGTPPPDVPSLYRDRYVEQVRHAVATLAEPGDRSAVTVALCAGAYWAVQAALDGPHRVVPVMVNPGALHWSADDHHERMRRHYRRLLFRRETWQRLFRGEISLVNAPRAFLHGIAGVVRKPLAQVRAALGRGPVATAPAPPQALTAPAPTSTAEVLEALEARGTHALLLMAGREPLLDELRRDGVVQQIAGWPRVTLEVIPGEADVHTLRPIWLQRQVHELLDAALDAELERMAPPATARRGG